MTKRLWSAVLNDSNDSFAFKMAVKSQFGYLDRARLLDDDLIRAVFVTEITYAPLQSFHPPNPSKEQYGEKEKQSYKHRVHKDPIRSLVAVTIRTLARAPVYFLVATRAGPIGKTFVHQCAL